MIYLWISSYWYPISSKLSNWDGFFARLVENFMAKRSVIHTCNTYFEFSSFSFIWALLKVLNHVPIYRWREMLWKVSWKCEVIHRFDWMAYAINLIGWWNATLYCVLQSTGSRHDFYSNGKAGSRNKKSRNNGTVLKTCLFYQRIASVRYVRWKMGPRLARMVLRYKLINYLCEFQRENRCFTFWIFEQVSVSWTIW